MVLSVGPNGVWAYRVSLRKMIPLHCSIWQLTLKISCLMLVTDTTLVEFMHWLVRSDTLYTYHLSVVLLVGPNDVWAYRVSLRKMIPLQYSIWQVTLKTNYLMMVTNTALVVFLHWLVRSETLCTQSPLVVLFVGPNGVWAYRVSLEKWYHFNFPFDEWLGKPAT